MAKFKIEINTDNAAFDAIDGSGPGGELAFILREIANHCANNLRAGQFYTTPIRDTNGNTCGKYSFTK